MMNKKTALLFGATGLVGNLLLEELIESGRYSLVRIFVRQATGIDLPGVEETVTDFSDSILLEDRIRGDDVFICLGTTIKKAGSVANMEKIDRDLPVKLAKTARRNGAVRIAVVSSIGAAVSSRNYYLRIKGEMEQGIKEAGYERTVIARPSMLLGDRKEWRTGEVVGKVLMKTVNPLLSGSMRKFRAIHGLDVARAMIILINGDPGTVIAESHELQKAAKSW
ncbi:MAG: NAD(P)H-binding protein [Bacteroidales bacterium]|nr:NAD(P)H-binding protein [Bacteroidales bacterium]